MVHYKTHSKNISLLDDTRHTHKRHKCVDKVENYKASKNISLLDGIIPKSLSKIRIYLCLI